MSYQRLVFSRKRYDYNDISARHKTSSFLYRYWTVKVSNAVTSVSKYESTEKFC